MRRELVRGSRVDAGGDRAATNARARFEAEGEPYKVELVDSAEGDISLYTQGDFTDLCRGPHLQDSTPIKAFKLTGLAGAYWRGDERNTQLTRIYGTAFFTQADLDAYLERLEQARANDHRRLGPQLDLFHLQDASPGSPFWHPKGMADLERARGPSPARERPTRLPRGQDAAHLRQVASGRRSGHWDEVPRRTCSSIAGEGEQPHAGLKPMNCPGHMLLFGTQLRSYRELPLRYAESSTLHRNEPTGTLHGLLARRGTSRQDDAHIFCTRGADRGRDRRLPRLRRATSTTCSGWSARVELSTRPDNKLGTDEEWDFTEGALRAALERRGIEYDRRRGRGGVLRAEDRPPHGRRRSVARGRWARSSSTRRCRSGSGSRYMGADNHEHTPYVIHRALFGSLERFIGILIEHYGGAFPVWLAPVQVRVLPVADAHADAGARARRTRSRSPASESTSTSATRRSASGSATPSSQKIPYVVVWGDRETREAMAVRQARGRGSRDDVARRARRRDRDDEPDCLVEGGAAGFHRQTHVQVLRSPPCKQERHRPSPRRPRAARGSTESEPTRECRRCMQWRFHEMRRIDSTW